MPATFTYKVRDSRGRLRDGKVDAENAEVVAQRLRQMGFVPLEIVESGSGMNREIKLGFEKRVKLRELAVFSRQFATMVNAGLTLLRALAILSEQVENPKLARAVKQIKVDVENGSSLSNAMARHPRIFPPLMVSMVRAGESGGFLDTTLIEVANNLESEVKLRAKVKSAMTYPTMVLIMALVSVTAMLIFIVPTFSKMFKNFSSDPAHPVPLPLPTQFMVTMSHIMVNYGIFIVIAAVAGIIVYQRNKHLPKVRHFMDPLKFRVPVLGLLFRKVAIARFARNLSTLLVSGVPILQALDIVGETSGSTVIEDAVLEVKESVRRGELLTKPLMNGTVFPPMVVQMMSVGESTGSLDRMLAKIAEFYDQEVEATTEQLTSLIEPIMIAVLGVIVGGMVIALYLPMFSIFNQIK
jgi:type IV pilus assembly protein PilC